MVMEQAVFLLMGLICHTQSSAYIQGQKIFSLEEIVPLMAEFYPERMSVQWISDTTYIYKDPGGIKKYDASTDKVVTILNEIELYNLSNYTLSTFSEDGKYVLLTKNRRKIYRYSFLAEYSVLDIEKRLIYKLSDYALQVVVWGIGKSVAYVQDNNVYYVPDITQADYVGALTTGGVPGEVYFGATDWIYEEEIFNAAEALWFSPGGTYLAVASFNDTDVESAVFPYYGDPGNINNQYPQMVQFKYPKVGRTNPRVGLRVYKLDEPNSEPWSIPAPVDVIGLDNILGRVNWASDQNLIVLWLNRRQSISILINCDLQKDKCSIVKEHTEPNGWIDINDPIFDKTGTKMVEIQPLYHAERRFPHAARVDFNTLTTEDLSPGNSTVLEIVGWNQDTNTVYYIVAPGNLPWLRQIWATSGGVVRCISCKEPTCRHVSAMFSPGANYAIVTCSACNIPPKIYLYDAKKETFKLIKDNKKLIDTLQMYQLPLTHFIAMSIGNEVNANVKLILPAGIKQGEQYAMVVRVYAGPGTTRVRDNYDLEYYNSYLATNRSIIVASIDVRGSGVMGVEAMHAVNRALGTVEISDTLDTIKSLTSLYSFIDPDRIGVWGWSYGGYATTMMLIQDQRNIVKCGAAVAPVTSWLYYDSIYTERYMDTPQANPLGYERSDLTNLAEGLRGRKYLLVHGSGDDNVHYQHSMQLAKRLQHSDIAFEQMSYTDENHSLMGVSRHFYHTLDRFWSECFKL
ncbi:venom dipeptidyl peptidase 4-like [Bombyx mandarina]|uniref:Venom dipeptidyl peptidase 4 n=1 Tax=Bombyx mandarina TaxID=7092 RepID=A0A6J2KHX4_BOMMA|nr:venom dipeptidyl peptidase 4-like [Bombyx mandarina]